MEGFPLKSFEHANKYESTLLAASSYLSNCHTPKATNDKRSRGEKNVKHGFLKSSFYTYRGGFLDILFEIIISDSSVKILFI